MSNSKSCVKGAKGGGAAIVIIQGWKAKMSWTYGRIVAPMVKISLSPACFKFGIAVVHCSL